MVKSIRRRPKGVPQLLKHKVRGKVYAYALFDGVRHSYGQFDAEARRLFGEDLESWKANGCRWSEEPDPGGDAAPASIETGPVTVIEVAVRHLEWLRVENPSPRWWANNGARINLAFLAVADEFADLPAEEFTKTQLGVLRDSLHSLTKKDGKTARLSRATITERLRYVRNMFDWAVTECVIEGRNVAGIDTALREFAKRKKGRPKARRHPVERWVVDATLPFLSSPLVALVELMWWTPARPSELLGLRPCDVNKVDESVWLVDLDEHKTAGHQAERIIKLGPKCIAVLRPFMLRPAQTPLFRPCDAVAEVQVRRRAERATPLTQSSQARCDREKATRQRRRVGETYRSDTFRKAIHRAIARANRDRALRGLDALPKWNPYDLRHAAITRLAIEHGRDGAQAAADHKESATTDIYCHTAREVGIRVAKMSS